MWLTADIVAVLFVIDADVVIGHNIVMFIKVLSMNNLGSFH